MTQARQDSARRTAFITETGPGTALPPRPRTATDAPVLDLNGTWDFHLTERAAEVPETPADHDDWQPITVPGSWQMQGWGAPAYTNVVFPFPVDPPHVPDENPVGDYRLVFDAPEEFLAGARLRFDGIDAVGVVWLNGTELGTTRGSRNTHELDVTGVLRASGNELYVRVAQWAATSYLEDQDMWWASGIFRDVSLVSTPAGGVLYAAVDAGFDHTTGHGTLTVRTDTHATWRIEELDAVGETSTVLEEGAIDLGEVEPWTPETPRLYTLTVSTAAETLTLRIGFRTVRITDGLITANGVPVRFRGMNRHDHDPRTGRTVTVDAIRADLVLMKQHNINAVRTSHYPPRPELLDLCDELGLWVIDETDLETHGFHFVQWRRNPSDDPMWRDAIIDRTERLVERDRNHPSVILWSLGNESSGGRNLLEAREWIHEHDPGRPVHYENDYGYDASDVYSQMYASVEHVERVGAGTASEAPGSQGKPYLMCEYAHAMGTGPGGLEEYEDLFRTYPRLQGGFVWEWRDHTIETPEVAQAYGGDFGEDVHDSNFVADGMVAADRTPRPGLADYKAVIAPAEITTDWREVTVRSWYDHGSTAHLAYRWRVETESGEQASGTLDVPVLAPGESATVALPALDVDQGTDTVLTVVAELAAETPWAPAGHEIGFGQAVSLAPVPEVERVTLAESGEGVRVGAATLDPVTAQLRDLGGAITGPRPSLWRAPTDNDSRKGTTGPANGDGADWAAQRLRYVRHAVRDVRVEDDALVADGMLAAPGLDWTVATRWRWSGAADGVTLDLAYEPQGEIPGSWARAGFDLEVPGGQDTVLRWFGRGPGPVYPDTGTAARWGWHTSTVADWQTAYAVPQDNGVRRLRRLELHLDGRVLSIAGEDLWVSVRPWSDGELADAAHPEELPPSDGLVIGVNLAVHGVGTAACGPGVLPQHRLEPREVRGAVHLAVHRA